LKLFQQKEQQQFSGRSEYIFTVKTQFGYCGKKQCWELGKEKPDSVPRGRGTSQLKMVKLTVLGAKVTQKRADYSTDKQASNCEGVYYKLISTFQ